MKTLDPCRQNNFPGGLPEITNKSLLTRSDEGVISADNYQSPKQKPEKSLSAGIFARAENPTKKPRFARIIALTAMVVAGACSSSSGAMIDFDKPVIIAEHQEITLAEQEMPEPFVLEQDYDQDSYKRPSDRTPNTISPEEIAEAPEGLNEELFPTQSEKKIDFSDILTGLKMSREELLDPSKPIPLVTVNPDNLIAHPKIAGLYSLPVNQAKTVEEKYYWFEPYVGTNERFGTLLLNQYIATLAQAWHQLYPDQPITIGDMIASGHLSHKAGNDFDVETFGEASFQKNKKLAANFLIPEYQGNYWGDQINPGDFQFSKDKTVQMMQLAARIVDEGGTMILQIMFFGDDNTIAHKNLSTEVNQTFMNSRPEFDNKVQTWPGHGDHLHLRTAIRESDIELKKMIEQNMDSFSNEPYPESQRH